MKLLRKAEVTEMVGVTYQTIWRWMREGRFPAPRTIGAVGDKDGSVRWVQSEVESWIEALPTRKYGGAPANPQLMMDVKSGGMPRYGKR